MTILGQQNSRFLTIAASTNLLSSKPMLLLAMLIATLALSACQTAPSTAASNSSVIIVDHSDMATISDNTIPSRRSDDYDYAVEPYIPPSQAPTDYDSADNSQNPLTQPSSPPTQPLPSFSEDSAVVSPLPEVMIESLPTDDDYIISQPPTMPAHSDLLERARQNSQQQKRQSAADSSDLPAFRNLMQVGTAQLQSGNLTAAENSFTRAQRIAPRSSAVYFYLSQVALKKNQPRKAEAMARRGLTVSQDANRRRSLWQLILRSGQAQNNARVIREAQQALR